MQSFVSCSRSADFELLLLAWKHGAAAANFPGPSSFDDRRKRGLQIYVLEE
jgi:hypothetical protein